MFLNGYPYTDFHELNLDFLLKSMEELKKAFASFTASNSLIFAEPMLHDLTSTYAKNTIVLDPDGNAYISLQNVPAGVQLSNADYWLIVFNFEEYIEKANKNFTNNYLRDTTRAPQAYAVGDWLVLDDVLYKVTVAIAADDLLEVGVNLVHFTIEQFLKDFVSSVNQTLTNWYNQMTGTINQYKNDIDASELAYRNQLAQDIADTTASLQSQLDLAISGATVDSEVINARLGADGITYPTLGDAIRTQCQNLSDRIDSVPDNENLFDYYDSRILTDSFITSGGSIVTIAGYKVSHPIPVKGGVEYKWDAPAGAFGTIAHYIICKYDGTFISYTNTSISGDVATITPSNDGYIRVNIAPDTEKPSYKFKFATTYAYTKYAILDEYLIDSIPTKKNLFDPYDSRNMNDKFINAGGTIITLAGYGVTHPIPVKGGVQYTYDAPAAAFGTISHYIICKYDGTLIDATTGSIVDGTVTISPPYDAFVMVSLPPKTTIAWDKFRFTTKYAYDLQSTELYNGRLKNKRILYNGDSIAEGRLTGDAANGGAYPKLINDLIGGTFENRAVSGATLSEVSGHNAICDDIANMSASGDIICLEGGINDYALNVPLGTYTPDDFSGAVDKTTLTGALESIFRQATAKWVGAPILFVITHKMSGSAWTANTEGYTFDDARKRMIEICNKYSIPYLDMFSSGGLTGYISAINTAYMNGGEVHPDGWHPDENGYKKYYIPRLISMFESLLEY